MNTRKFGKGLLNTINLCKALFRTKSNCLDSSSMKSLSKRDQSTKRGPTKDKGGKNRSCREGTNTKSKRNGQIIIPQLDFSSELHKWLFLLLFQKQILYFFRVNLFLCVPWFPIFEFTYKFPKLLHLHVVHTAYWTSPRRFGAEPIIWELKLGHNCLAWNWTWDLLTPGHFWLPGPTWVLVQFFGSQLGWN